MTARAIARIRKTTERTQKLLSDDDARVHHARPVSFL